MTKVVRVVNIVPNSRSNETNQDSEPSIAVNPSNPAEIVVTAFTPPDTGVTDGPIYFSNDGGLTWQLNFAIAGGEPADQTVAFATTGGELFGGMINTDAGQLDEFRTPAPSASGTFDVFKKRDPCDQPWMEARTVVGGPDDGKVRTYYGCNNSFFSSGPSATVDICLDSLASNPTVTRISLDPRTVGAGLNDGYAIRPVAHSDGTVYVAYEGWRSGAHQADITTDIVVARDDNWGQGFTPFSDLKDPSDTLAGRLVQTGVVINDGGYIGQERLNNDLAIAVDPGNSDTVYIAWADNAGPDYTLRVRRSLNRGADWSGDLLTADNATMASMTINGDGQVGLMYQQVVAGNWETHFRRTTDSSGTNWDDTTLSVAPSDTPVNVTDPYLGDWARVVAVGPQFYGAFCANNSPVPGNFPSGVVFARNHNDAVLLQSDGVTPVPVSIDPFFYRIGEATLTVVTDRNTISKDEIDAALHQASPAVIEKAFQVSVDGFRHDELGVTVATLTGTPDVAPTISFSPALEAPPAGASRTPATSCSVDGGVLIDAPQRFTWTYSFQFFDDSDFTQEIEPITLTATMTSTAGETVDGQGVITLTEQPNPYEVDGATSYLSVDLQVFQILANGALPSTPAISLSGSPNDFIHDLLANTNGGYNDPSLPRAPNHPFDRDLVANEDSSSVNIAGSVGGFPPFIPGIPVHNFAVARVRYRALSTPAPNVRVFFRLFPALTTSTDFQPTTTYATGGQAGAEVPLLGVISGEVVSIPFFAAPRVNPSGPNGLDAQTDPDNVGPVGEDIPPDSSGDEVQVYFGCWLDINQTTAALPNPNGPATAAGPYTPVQSIQQAIRGKHQCLVAEIHLDPPEPQIIVGTTPANSDKLAQRNLTIVGVASPHQAPLTFEIKPTSTFLPAKLPPDELMLDLSDLPSGSIADVYLPGIESATVINTANRLYASHSLSRVDSHTVRCRAGGITYLPIPPGLGSNYAGLLTVEVPPTVRRGQNHVVIARQITNKSAKRPAPPPPPPVIQVRERTAADDVAPAIIVENLVEWRQVLGSFQLTIPVKTRGALLGPEERLLSVLRWIAEGIPHHNRWYPVFQRYLEQIAGRVSGLGGDPGKILPTPSGDGGAYPRPPHGPLHAHPGRSLDFTGKINGLIYDGFGDFIGFHLETEHGEHEFSSREGEIEALARRAWRERLRITVRAERHEPHRPQTIILRDPPAPFEAEW